ncbi:MAG: hypothetical protein ACREQV_09165 [Candidatus Binatia bacterium]
MLIIDSASEEEPTHHKEEIIMGAPLVTAKSAGAALVADAGARSAKEASHA